MTDAVTQEELDYQNRRKKALANLQTKRANGMTGNSGAKVNSGFDNDTDKLKSEIASKARQAPTPDRMAKRNKKPKFIGARKKNKPGVFGANQNRGYDEDNTMAKAGRAFGKGLDAVAMAPINGVKKVAKMAGKALYDAAEPERQAAKDYRKREKTSADKTMDLKEANKRAGNPIGARANRSNKLMRENPFNEISEADRIERMRKRRRKSNEDYEKLYNTGV